MEVDREYWEVGGKIVPRPTLDETVTIVESRGVPTCFTSEDLESMWLDELQERNLPYIPMVVSRYGHKIGKRDAYADATFRGSPDLPSPYYKVTLHPLLLYTNENYVRKVIRHELGHIVSDAKRRKATREALGL